MRPKCNSGQDLPITDHLLQRSPFTPRRPSRSMGYRTPSGNRGNCIPGGIPPPGSDKDSHKPPPADYRSTRQVRDRDPVASFPINRIQRKVLSPRTILPSSTPIRSVLSTCVPIPTRRQGYLGRSTNGQAPFPYRAPVFHPRFPP